jgi:hypothetical protein
VNPHTRYTQALAVTMGQAHQLGVQCQAQSDACYALRQQDMELRQRIIHRERQRDRECDKVQYIVGQYITCQQRIPVVYQTTSNLSYIQLLVMPSPFQSHMKRMVQQHQNMHDHQSKSFMDAVMGK